MKLGSDTTSYTNYCLAQPRVDEPNPSAGMAATVLRRTDRVAATVTHVFLEGERLFVQVQEDEILDHPECSITHEPTDVFVRDSNGRTHTFFKGLGGYWHHVSFNKRRQIWMHQSADSLHLGTRRDSRIER